MTQMDFTVADKSYNKETGELEQFLVFWSGGEPELKRASAENVLLFDPEEELPFENGMYEFLNGKEALLLSEDPEIIVAPTGNEYAYILRVRGNTVETTPDQAEAVLQGVLDAATDSNTDRIMSVYDDIMASSVRRRVINALYHTFDETNRIEVASNGWLIDEFYLVDWTASIYTKEDDPDEGDYVRSGGQAVKKDDSYEFVHLRMHRNSRELEQIEVTISGDTYRLTEREMLFLAKVKWMLNRRHYHPDIPFWMTTDQHAAVDWKTGEPEDQDDEEPNMDEFEL